MSKLSRTARRTVYGGASPTMPDSMAATLALFPSVVLFTAATLRAGPYRRLVDPVECFERTRRPASLRRALGAILIVGGAVYAALLLIRLRIILGMIHHAAAGLALSSVLTVGAASMLCLTLGCELLVVTHLFFYLRLCRVGVASYRKRAVPPLPATLPKVAVLIPACDESPETLARPLGSLAKIAYANCRVILIENSRDAAKKRLAIQTAQTHGVEVLDLPNRRTKAAALNDARTMLDEDTAYIAVLDADQLLRDDIVSDLVALLEAEPAAAWVQTAQVYDDGSSSLLASAATQQLLVLYDSALQGKDVRGLCPMLGTNFLVRLDALDAVGGWQEGYVNEDTATSYRIQLRGMKGRYHQHIYAAGLAPPLMEALWNQQRRWAYSNSKLAFAIVREFFDKQRRPKAVVADYLALTSYELLTFIIALLAIIPSLTLIGAGLAFPRASETIRVVESWQWVFASLYPLHLLLIFFPHVNMGLRGYPLRNLVLMQGLVACLSTAYLQGVKQALLGRRPLFESALRKSTDTPTAEPERKGPAPQVVGLFVFSMLGSLSLAIALHHRVSPFPWIVTFWSAFHCICLAHYVIFASDEQRVLKSIRAAQSSGAAKVQHAAGRTG